MTLWVDWSGTAQSIDAGLRGSTNLEANVGRPGPTGAPGARGPVGPGADEAVAVNFSQQAGTAFRGALAASNDVGVIFMGDSKTSGTGVMLHTNRWQNRLGALLRTQYPISGGDTGRGVIPAHMPDAYNQMSGRPVWSAGVLAADTQGLGLNTAHIPAGETVTFPAITLPTGGGTIHVGYHTNNGLGNLQLVTGSTVRGTYNCAGAGDGEPLRSSFTLPAGTHTIVARAQAGGNPARISYIDVRTSNTGIHLIDSARAGACAYHVARGPMGAPGAPASYKSAVAQLGNLALAVVAYGANDMSENSPTQYAADLLGVYTMLKEAHPRIGVLIILPAALTGAPPRSFDPATGVVWNYRAYHAAARRVLDGKPDITVMSESVLIDLLGPNMDRWLADSVHPKEFGHEQIAHAAMGAILGLDRQGAKGDPGTGNTPHADTHAIGGTDPITPENIGAATASQYTELLGIIQGVGIIKVGGSAPASGWWLDSGAPVYDPTAPSAPTGLTATATGSTTVSLSWTASTDNVGVTGYEYRIGSGSAIDAGAGTSETVSGLTASTFYPSFSVRAYDAAGNRSAWSTPASATTLAGPDVTPPTPGILTVSAITQTSFTLTVTGASDAGTGLHAQPYRFSFDNGTTWSAWQANAGFDVSGRTASTAYTCLHGVRDAAGNESVGSSILVTTSDPAPTVADTFDRADTLAGTLGTTTIGGKVWADPATNWRILGNKAAPTVAQPSGPARITDVTPTTDMRVNFTYSFANAANGAYWGAVYACYDPTAQDYYQIFFTHDPTAPAITIAPYVAGAGTGTLAGGGTHTRYSFAAPLAVNEEVTVSVIFKTEGANRRVTLFVNGVQRVSDVETRAAKPSGRGLGLTNQNNAARIDNLAVYTV